MFGSKTYKLVLDIKAILENTRAIANKIAYDQVAQIEMLKTELDKQLAAKQARSEKIVELADLLEKSRDTCAEYYEQARKSKQTVEGLETLLNSQGATISESKVTTAHLYKMLDTNANYIIDRDKYVQELERQIEELKLKVAAPAPLQQQFEPEPATLQQAAQATVLHQLMDVANVLKQQLSNAGTVAQPSMPPQRLEPVPEADWGYNLALSSGTNYSPSVEDTTSGNEPAPVEMPHPNLQAPNYVPAPSMFETEGTQLVAQDGGFVEVASSVELFNEGIFSVGAAPIRLPSQIIGDAQRESLRLESGGVLPTKLNF